MPPEDAQRAPRHPGLTAKEQLLIEARCHDPHSVLGAHPSGAGERLCVFMPGAVTVAVLEAGITLEECGRTGLFFWEGPSGLLPRRYRVTAVDVDGRSQTRYDPYCFQPQVSDLDLYLLAEGRHWQAYRVLGAHTQTIDGVAGVRFAVWAPTAARVSVVGPFNDWDGRRHPMQVRGASGVWELFVPELPPGTLYKFELRHRDSGAVLLKTDPCGQAFERPPATAAIVTSRVPYAWQDHAWLQARAHRDWQRAPLSVYEVHLGSWRRDAEGQFLDYREAARQLVDHVRALGFTHIQLLPVTEHPFDGSWGYQTTGYYAPTRRFGTPDDFRFFVDYCHRHEVGVLLDWVPGHFPRDAHGLAQFDGSALYEHEDPRRGAHQDWGTLIFNYGRNEVRNFLIASALYWLNEFHVDGLRVDAVASMLYLDYSRKPGDWIPNIHGGRENLEAIDFLRQLNHEALTQYPGTLMIAEESTAWPQVTRPAGGGGLGFSMKWSMGWMHDTLAYMSLDPVHRRHHHERLTFGMLYAFSENFVLPFSHDEVVHGKRSLLGRMPGDDWQRFANLRLLYTYLYTYPGKKLLFMGSEFGQCQEWDHDRALPWALLDKKEHAGVQTLVRDLNRVYRQRVALHGRDFEHEGFEWIDCEDRDQSVLSYVRRDGAESCLVVLNFTPVPRHSYRLGAPCAGTFRELINSDSSHYGGSNLGNGGLIHSDPIPAQGRSDSLCLTLPPLAGLVLGWTGS